MLTRQQIWHRLLSAERDARGSRWRRFLTHPFLYPVLLFFHRGIYPVTRRSIPWRISTFYGLSLKTMLPSGTDMALHAIKAHDAEIRLSKYLTLTLQEGDTFIDVGAHYGYYTLMASALTGDTGHIHAIEASAQTAILLKQNIAARHTVIFHHMAASDAPGEITFYEYPGPYAEYNTTLKDAYRGQAWRKKIPRLENRVRALPVDEILSSYAINRATIKIDAEGGESAVIRGLTKSMRECDLTIIMEYNLPETGPAPNRDTVSMCKALGYTAHAIQRDGSITVIADVEAYMKREGLETDNLVLKKSR